MKNHKKTKTNEVQDLLQYALKNHRAGNFDEAETVYRKIINRYPKQADALHLLGLIEYQKKNYEVAELLIRKAILCDRNVPFFFLNLGNVLRDQGRINEAVEYYRKAIRINPDFPEARYNLANELFKKGFYEEAISNYKTAISLNPFIAEFYFNLARAYQESARYEESANSYEKALSLKPYYPEAFYNLGIIFQEQKKYNESANYYIKAIHMKPDYEAAYYNLGDVLNEMEKFDEAETYLKKAISIKPDFAEAYNNLSISLRNQGKIEEALEASKKALDIRSDFAEAYNNLGIAFRTMGNIEEAIRSFNKALTVNPYLSEAHFNMSLAMLSSGDFRNGWKKYEWRFMRKNAIFRDIRIPLWDGIPHGDKTILVYSEQGIGDEIMFISCLSDLIQVWGCSIVVECDRRLKPLFSRSFPDVEFIERGSKLHNFDFRIPIGSLAKFYRNSLEDFPEKKSYLIPDTRKLIIWKERMNELGPGLKVGISWRGGKDPAARSLRSTNLEQWMPVFYVKGVEFINLQYGDCYSEINDFFKKYGIRINDWEDADPLNDLDFFAAQVSALDLVISIDNSTVHMAGALGIPVWTLLPYGGDWRWMLNYEDTPWYPSMRLFRQKNHCRWEEVFERVAWSLSKLVESGHIEKPLDENSYKKHLYNKNCGNGKNINASYSNNKKCTNKNNSLRCAVVTPVGPGHENIYKECLESVQKASTNNKGKFAEIIHLVIDDTGGKIGRSNARNIGIKKAADTGVDWIFFLDADDIMMPFAFEYVSPYLDYYDGIWGSIWTIESEDPEPKERPGQLHFIYNFDELFYCDPFLTLQMGHFVKTSAALETPFNENLDAGEDFEYYLRLWKKYTCIKIPLPFFYNRRGLHSTGLHSATGRDWRQTVENIFRKYRQG